MQRAGAMGPAAVLGLRSDLVRIWKAGVDAVQSHHLVRQALQCDGQHLIVAGQPVPLAPIRRILVVGAGKAGAGMAAAVEEVLGPQLAQQKQLSGWVNVPEDCVRPLRYIHLHGARPPGINEPTPQAEAGAARMIQMVHSLGPEDLCLALISGGGSALLPAPAEGITLQDKLAITRHLSAAGANIQQLNTVRKQLSRVKGGGLWRSCRAGRLIALIISDVLGDPLEIIASGPTVEDSSTPQEALAILRQFGVHGAGIAPNVLAYLERKSSLPPARPTCHVTNLVIGNLATAVEAAAAEARRLGYPTATHCAAAMEGPAETVAQALVDWAWHTRDRTGGVCLVSGGEPVVKLVEASRRGLGGRNQQLVLAAAMRLWEDGAERIGLLSGGTDGEDGPTDAAGAWLDAAVIAAAKQRGMAPADFLARNDAYHFFEPLGALLKTGPTHTNVCDVRVVIVARDASPAPSRPPNPGCPAPAF